MEFIDSFSVIIFVIIVGFVILQIILFFKLWGMTNNVRDICEKLERIIIIMIDQKSIEEKKDTKPKNTGIDPRKTINEMYRNK